jgi:ABC-type glutathione transport system ATPase component
MTLLDVALLSVRYGRGDAVFLPVSFSLHAGDVMFVVGKSGVGKSTLLRALGGVLPHGATTSGTVTGPTRPQLGWQSSTSLAPHMTVGDLLSEAAQIQRRRIDVDDVRTLLRSVGLASEFIDQRPAQLSSGQRQRVVLARALSTNASVILLDEPTAHLDPIARRQLAQLLGSLRAARAFVIATHDRDFTSLFSDDGVRMMAL